MPMSEETCRAIDILRGLRRSSPSDPWTAAELSVAIQYTDDDIVGRLAGQFRLDKREEDAAAVHQTVRQIVEEWEGNAKPIPALAGVRQTLRILKRNLWVRSARGRGYWLTKLGESVTLLEVLNACGYNGAITRCSHRGKDEACPYAETCAAHRFYEDLTDALADAYGKITIEDIDMGACRIEARVVRPVNSQSAGIRKDPFPLTG